MPRRDRVGLPLGQPELGLAALKQPAEPRDPFQHLDRRERREPADEREPQQVPRLFRDRSGGELEALAGRCTNRDIREYAEDRGDIHPRR
jgi:hypothetical protein